MTTTKTTSKIKSKNFEQTLVEIEKIVEDIESGNLPLEEVVDRFKVCAKMITDCRSLLSNVEMQIETIQTKLTSNDKEA